MDGGAIGATAGGRIVGMSSVESQSWTWWHGPELQSNVQRHAASEPVDTQISKAAAANNDTCCMKASFARVLAAAISACRISQ